MVTEIHVHLCSIVMYDLKLFIVALQELQCIIKLFTTMFTMIVLVCSLNSTCLPNLVVMSMNYMCIYVPIVMYSLRLFIVVYKNYVVYQIVHMLFQ